MGNLKKNPLFWFVKFTVKAWYTRLFTQCGYDVRTETSDIYCMQCAHTCTFDSLMIHVTSCSKTVWNSLHHHSIHHTPLPPSSSSQIRIVSKCNIHVFTSNKEQMRHKKMRKLNHSRIIPNFTISFYFIFNENSFFFRTAPFLLSLCKLHVSKYFSFYFFSVLFILNVLFYREISQF